MRRTRFRTAACNGLVSARLAQRDRSVAIRTSNRAFESDGPEDGFFGTRTTSPKVERCRVEKWTSKGNKPMEGQGDDLLETARRHHALEDGTKPRSRVEASGETVGTRWKRRRSERPEAIGGNGKGVRAEVTRYRCRRG